MTADAIGLQDVLCMIRSPDEFGDPPGIENHHVFQAVQGFPDVMGGNVIARKMAVDTVYPAVRSFVKPGLILRLHDMA